MLYFIPPAFPLYPSVAMNMVSITPLLIQFIVVQIPFSHGIISENLGRLCVMVAGQKSLLHLGHPIYHLCDCLRDQCVIPVKSSQPLKWGARLD